MSMRSIALVVLLLSAAQTVAEPELPLSFGSFNGALAYIAKYESPEDRPATVAQLLPRSIFTLHHFTGAPDLTVMVCEPALFSSEGILQNRGAAGNGSLFVLREAGKRWTLVGLLYGNGHKVVPKSNPARILTSAHFAADETEEYVYTWNGTVFSETERFRIVRGKRVEFQE